MTVAMNPARMPCPKMLAMGKCDADSCPYNHSKINTGKSDHLVQAASKSRMAQILTGASGQFVGGSKGANTVPISNTSGGLPSFVQKAAKKLVTIKAATSQNPQASTTKATEREPERSAPAILPPTLKDDAAASVSSEDLAPPATVDFDELQKKYGSLCHERVGLEMMLRKLLTETSAVDQDLRELKQRMPVVTKTAQSNRQCSTDLRQLVASNRTIAIQIKQAEELANVHEAMIAECRQKYGTLLDRIEDSDMIAVDGPKHDINDLLNSIERQFKQLNSIVHRVQVDFTNTARNRQNQLLASEGFAPGEYLSVLRNSQNS